MASEKFTPSEEELSEVEIRLECLRLAAEFGAEYQRQDPIPQAEKYFDWVQVSKKTTRKEPSKKKV
jgi:hypothetical protein